MRNNSVLLLGLLLSTLCAAQEVKVNKIGMTMDEFKTLHAEQFKNGFHLAAHCYMRYMPGVV